MPHWLAHLLGLDNPASPWTLWWSGSGSVIVPLFVSILIFGAGWYWHNQCEVDGCRWPARRRTAAGERACFRHHPRPKPTVQDLRARHHAALRASRSSNEGSKP